MRGIAILALLALCACSSGPPACTSDEVVLGVSGGESLTCAEAAPLTEYASLLAGRSLGASSRTAMRAALVDEFQSDARGARARLAKMHEAAQALRALDGMQAVERRSEQLFEARRGRGLFGPNEGALYKGLSAAVVFLAVDDDTGIAMGESDMEGWIQYTSLCREVQGGGTLKLSIAHREQVYRSVKQKFNEADRDNQLGLLAFGAFWKGIRGRWQAATYDEQQAWMLAAPLPPPMRATSLGYAEALLEGSPRAHGLVFHKSLGPLKLDAPD